MSIKGEKGYTLIITLIIVFILALLSAILLGYITQENKLNITIRTSTLLIQDFESAVELGVVWVSANYPNITSTIVDLPNGYTYKQAHIKGEELTTNYMNGVSIVKLSILFPATANTEDEADHVINAFVYVMTKVGEDIGSTVVGVTPNPYPAYLFRWGIVK